ncbi:MAG TPA: nuclear transport factor 2 family protein [Gemmatimonadaceae bacterium]|nr:nuclear transport factor 2 family protein [Gemmatimonadaceae bacterium]
MRILTFAACTLLVCACGKTTSSTADSTGAPSSFDESTARSQIIAADSAFVRAIISKNVDSLMAYYDASVVSLGKTAVKGTADLRKSYEQVVKSPPRDINFQSEGVSFSNDHSMAWDYGTVSQTADLKGKPVKSSGTYLNVWKNVAGSWKIVAEISSASP